MSLPEQILEMVKGAAQPRPEQAQAFVAEVQAVLEALEGLSDQEVEAMLADKEAE